MDGHLELQIVDKAKALQRLDSDEELYQEVLEIFLEDTPIQLNNLQQALSNNAINEVLRLSHSLKSAAGNIGAERLSVASFSAEKAAKNGHIEDLPHLIASIQTEFNTLLEFLKKSGM